MADCAHVRLEKHDPVVLANAASDSCEHARVSSSIAPMKPKAVILITMAGTPVVARTSKWCSSTQRFFYSILGRSPQIVGAVFTIWHLNESPLLPSVTSHPNHKLARKS